MSKHVQHFADVANAFCTWAEESSEDQIDQVPAALALLSNLYQLALVLPELFDEQDAPEIQDQDWKKVFARFGSMPFNYYSQFFDPLEVTGEPTVADLADDLADIWRDLKRGLLLFQAGNVAAACWQWRQSFWSHWGQHATGALHALHSWYCQGDVAAMP